MLHIPSGVKSRAENTNGRTDGVYIGGRASPFIYSAYVCVCFCVCECMIERLISGREPFITAMLYINLLDTHTHTHTLRTWLHTQQMTDYMHLKSIHINLSVSVSPSPYWCISILTVWKSIYSQVYKTETEPQCNPRCLVCLGSAIIPV